MVAVANGIATMNINSARLRNSSVRSIVAKPLNSMWWFTHVIPMVRKLTT